MEERANSKSIILNYGIYFGISSILIFLVKYATGMQYEQEWYSGLFSFIAMIAFIILGIKAFKKLNNGFLSFGQALKVGLGITLIATLITILYYVLFSNIIEPNFMEKTIETQKVIWEDNYGMNGEQIEQAEQRTRDWFYLSLYGGVVIVNLFLGFVISAITGAVMKKSENNDY